MLSLVTARNRSKRGLGHTHPIDFRHLHKMHLEASLARDELLEEARSLQTAGKIRLARERLDQARRIQDSLSAFEAALRSPGGHKRDRRFSED